MQNPKHTLGNGKNQNLDEMKEKSQISAEMSKYTKVTDLSSLLQSSNNENKNHRVQKFLPSTLHQRSEIKDAHEKSAMNRKLIKENPIGKKGSVIRAWALVGEPESQKVPENAGVRTPN